MEGRSMTLEENRIKNSKSDYEKVVGLIERFIGFLALFSAILYFLGWTKANAYYLHFGLTLELLGKSSVTLVSSAWFEIVLGVTLILAGYYIQVVINNLIYITNLSTLKKTLNLFYILLMASIVGGIYFFLQTTIFRNFNFMDRSRDVGFMLLFVFIFWITANMGRKISIQTDIENTSKGIKFFRFIYPNANLFLFISILGMAYVLVILSAARGLYYGVRDTKNPADNLPAIILVTNSPLPMNGNLDTASGLYVYDNLFYIDSNDKYIFVYGDPPDFDSSKLFHTYIIPKSEGVQMLIKK